MYAFNRHSIQAKNQGQPGPHFKRKITWLHAPEGSWTMSEGRIHCSTKLLTATLFETAPSRDHVMTEIPF